MSFSTRLVTPARLSTYSRRISTVARRSSPLQLAAAERKRNDSCGHFNSRPNNLATRVVTFSSSSPSPSSSLSPPSNPSPNSKSSPSSLQFKIPTSALEPRLSLTFTCTAVIPVPPVGHDASTSTHASTPTSMSETTKQCSRRSTHEFTRRAYEKGVVLIECPGCKNQHLIADNLGWFKDDTKDGKLRTVEDLMKAKGEKVRRGRRVGGQGEGEGEAENGVIEYYD